MLAHAGWAGPRCREAVKLKDVASCVLFDPCIMWARISTLWLVSTYFMLPFSSLSVPVPISTSQLGQSMYHFKRHVAFFFPYWRALVASPSLICWEHQSFSQLGIFVESALSLLLTYFLRGILLGQSYEWFYALPMDFFIMGNFKHIQKDNSLLWWILKYLWASFNNYQLRQL